MTHRFRLVIASTLTVLLALSSMTATAGADAATDAAILWLEASQEADGGFELADFPPFETPDAVLALAEDAQTSPTWSPAQALAAVGSLDANGGIPGGTPLAWADAFLSGATPSAGVAAKFIVLVAAPTGQSTTAFDPAANGAPVDLEALMDAGELPDHSYGAGALNATLYALLAHDVLGRPVPEDTVAYLRSAQQANGGWSFTGDPAGTDIDIDTTALALSALVASGVPAGDSAVAGGLRLLANQHQPNGAWQSFDADDPNSSALGLLGVEAAGWSTATSCWRTSASSAAATTPYVDPDTWLRSQQITDGADRDLGRIASPSDAFGVNTLPTSQALHALLGSWFPVATAAAPRTEGFADVGPCAWYTQGVAWMAANGITRNTSGAYGPKSSITNGQVALLLWNMMDAPVGLPAHTFTDVPAGAPYDDALDWMVDAGLVTDGGRYQPKRQVNRGRIVYLLWKIAGEPVAPDLVVNDVPNDAFYADAVDWAVDQGLIARQPNGNILPRNKVTRAQAAVMLHRLASTAPAWGEVALPSTVEF